MIRSSLSSRVGATGILTVLAGIGIAYCMLAAGVPKASGRWKRASFKTPKGGAPWRCVVLPLGEAMGPPELSGPALRFR
jgi:hypothetical protein